MLPSVAEVEWLTAQVFFFFVCVFKLLSVWLIFSHIFNYFQPLVAKTTMGERLL